MWGISEFFLHFFGQFIEEGGIIFRFVLGAGLRRDLVVDDLVVFAHLSDHLAVDGRKGRSGQLIIFAQVEVLEVALNDIA